MIVVSNASPFRYLILIDAAHVLPRLFGEVIIPPAVHCELTRESTPTAVRTFMEAAPDWLKVRSPTAVDPTLRVHVGEAQAILLAKELDAARLLVDDRKAIEAARTRGVRTTRTPALLGLAAEEKLIDLEIAFQRLKQTTFEYRRRCWTISCGISWRDMPPERDDTRVQTQVRRIIWLRRHRVALQVLAVVVGAAVPPAAAWALMRVLELTVPAGGLLPLGMCFVIPLTLALILPGAIIGYKAAESITNRRVPYSYCQFCGYNLQDYAVPRCPECGKATASEY